jgi:acyl-CoA thioesterase II
VEKHGGVPASRLAALLDLEVLDRDLFRGENEEGAGARMSLYGGQVAAQALRAAGATVPEDRLPHSLHDISSGPVESTGR